MIGKILCFLGLHDWGVKRWLDNGNYKCYCLTCGKGKIFKKQRTW